MAAAYAAWCGCRLPTEAEWERAARGTETRRYPWGNRDPAPTSLNFGGNVGHATPVGVYPCGATPEGLLDMAGNVWEWCQCAFRDYPAGDSHDHVIAAEDGNRVLRGGCWNSRARRCRGASRDWNHPSARSQLIGFRLDIFGEPSSPFRILW